MENLIPIDKLKCSKCNANQIIPGLQVIDKALETHGSISKMTIEIIGDPNAIFDQEKVDSPIQAFLCSNCGFIELYAIDPKKIVEKYNEVYNKLSKTLKK